MHNDRMKIKLAALAVLALSLLILSAPAYCWDKYAHMLICQIAYSRLTPRAKSAVGSLVVELNKNPDVTVLTTAMFVHTPQLQWVRGWTISSPSIASTTRCILSICRGSPI